LARTLVTGSTGFIGSQVARRVLERGDEVRLAVAPGASDRAIRDLDCQRVECDVLDEASVRKAMRGVTRVFHCAGLTSVRPADSRRLFDVNAGGARIVLGECLRKGVERVVFNSSAAALGPAKPGGTADEAQHAAGPFGIPYVDSVHQAEEEAMRLLDEGLQLVCVNPCVAFGPGDYNLGSTRIVRSFLLGRVPMYVDGAFSVVDVRDVARGMQLADERGEIGERYILGGRNFTFDRLFADLARLSGIEPPVRVPTPVALAAAATLGDRAPVSGEEVRAAAHWWTYRSTKARRELSWRARPHEETLEATVKWHLEREHDRIARTRRSQQIQYRLAGAAFGAVESAAGLAGQVLRRSRLV
jgi:dihydroflavonol-4-reductase